MKINFTNVTEKQLMNLQLGLIQYEYIRSHYQIDDEDFRDVFTSFYLSSQARMRNSENRNPFFELLRETKADSSLIDIVNNLNEKLPLGMYEFSFATKLLHTVNNSSPIYDSKIYQYLKKERNVDFWDIQSNKCDSDGNKYSKIDKIKHNWEELKNWYNSFILTNECDEWIKWFDNNFPNYQHISNVKKIDFIIFSLSGY